MDDFFSLPGVNEELGRFGKGYFERLAYFDRIEMNDFSGQILSVSWR